MHILPKSRHYEKSVGGVYFMHKEVRTARLRPEAVTHLQIA